MKKFICIKSVVDDNRFYKILKINEIYFVEEYLTDIDRNFSQYLYMNVYDKNHKQILGGCGIYIYEHLKEYSIYRKEKIAKILGNMI